MAGRPKGRNDIASQIRGAFMRGLMISEEKTNKSLSELIADAIENEGILKVMDAISKYCPREMSLEVTELSPEQWLELMADECKSESTGTTEKIPRPVH